MPQALRNQSFYAMSAEEPPTYESSQSSAGTQPDAEELKCFRLFNRLMLPLVNSSYMDKLPRAESFQEAPYALSSNMFMNAVQEPIEKQLGVRSLTGLLFHRVDLGNLLLRLHMTYMVTSFPTIPPMNKKELNVLECESMQSSYINSKFVNMFVVQKPEMENGAYKDPTVEEVFRSAFDKTIAIVSQTLPDFKDRTYTKGQPYPFVFDITVFLSIDRNEETEHAIQMLSEVAAYYFPYGDEMYIAVSLTRFVGLITKMNWMRSISQAPLVSASGLFYVTDALKCNEEEEEKAASGSGQ